MVRVLFVCLGNICRSPSAEGVFRRMVREAGLDGRVEIDSAGTGPWHVGKGADARSAAAAKRRGIDLSAHVARQVTGGDVEGDEAWDFVVVMDASNRTNVLSMCGSGGRERVRMMMEWHADSDVTEVPDPYFGHGDEGFEHVLDLLEGACAGLLEEVKGRLGA